MDRAYIDNHHVVERYLADRLSEEERRAFESALLSDPSVVRDVEAVVRLKVGLARLSRTNELDGLLHRKSWYREPRWLAMAASVAIVAIGLFAWLGRGVFAPPTLVASLGELSDARGTQLAIASSYAILRTRGPVYDAEIELPPTPHAIELRVLPEYEAQPPRYRVSLARIADDDSLTLVGSLDALTPADDGFVTLYFDSSTLAKGRYQLTLSGDTNTSAADAMSQFRVKLTEPGAPAR